MARVSGPQRVPSITCSGEREDNKEHGVHRDSPQVGSNQVTLLPTRSSELHRDSHLGLEHFELTPPPGSAE